MALDKTSLTNALQDLFEGHNGSPQNETEAGTKWANIYRQYAAKAMAGPAQPLAPSLNGAGTKLGGALAAAFTTAKAAGPAALAVTLDGAFVAFWMSPPVAFAPAAPTTAGVVSLAPPGVLAPLLSAAFLAGIAPGITAARQAQAIAAILDTWTKTIMVINTPITPPGPPAPPVPLV